MFVKREKELNRAVEMLRKGKIILYPTDTLWGIGCDATNSKAVQKIYKLKKRVESKSLIVLLGSPAKLHEYVKKIPETAYDLIEQFPEPLTIVFSGARNLAKNVIAKDGSIAIRIVRSAFCVEMLNLFAKPIVSTSANFAGIPSPLTYDEISNEIILGVDYAVDFHRNRLKSLKPSTIIKIDENNRFTVLRP